MPVPLKLEISENHSTRHSPTNRRIYSNSLTTLPVGIFEDFKSTLTEL